MMHVIHSKVQRGWKWWNINDMEAHSSGLSLMPTCSQNLWGVQGFHSHPEIWFQRLSNHSWKAIFCEGRRGGGCSSNPSKEYIKNSHHPPLNRDQNQALPGNYLVNPRTTHSQNPRPALDPGALSFLMTSHAFFHWRGWLLLQYLPMSWNDNLHLYPWLRFFLEPAS